MSPCGRRRLLGREVGQTGWRAMDGLDDFSQSFADALFAAVPDLRDHARAERGLLLIDIQPGPERQHCAFWISSDNEEITVGFGRFHTHFCWPLADPWPENDPIRFIQSVMADETLIEDRALDGKWIGSSILASTAEPDLRGMRPGSVIHIRSWSGARDRMISER